MIHPGSVVIVEKNGTVVGTEPIVDFVEGTNIALTVSDVPASGKVTVTIASSTTGTGADNNLLIMNLGGWKA